MHWARAALDRNPSLTVLAEDDAGKVFTLRLATGSEVRVVPLAQLIAGPPTGDNAGATAVPDARNTPAPNAPPTDNMPATPSSEAPGVLAQAPASRAAAVNASGGRVLASGPGYSIEAAGPATRAGGTASVSREVAVPRSEPIICQGDRRLRIDGQNLEFSGDAIIAESGCDLHITNSRIHAAGAAITARAAHVQIENSTIEGTDCVDASAGAQIYLQASSFRGLSRQLDSAQLHDLGGNLWN